MSVSEGEKGVTVLMPNTTIYGIKCEVCGQQKPKGRRMKPLGYLYEHLVCSECESLVIASWENRKKIYERVAIVMGRVQRPKVK